MTSQESKVELNKNSCTGVLILPCATIVAKCNFQFLSKYFRNTTSLLKKNSLLPSPHFVYKSNS